MNFAENLLYPGDVNIDPNSPAIIEANEFGNSSITWKELRDRVAICALAFRVHGVHVSDRIAGFLGNHANTVVAMLAAASIGAIWTGVSPDTGVTAVLERLVQISPKVLLVDNAVRYNGKVHGSYRKVKEVVQGLKGLRACVMFETVEGFEMDVDGLELESGQAWTYDEFVKWSVSHRVSNFMLRCTVSISPLPSSTSISYRHLIHFTFYIPVERQEHQNVLFIPLPVRYFNTRKSTFFTVTFDHAIDCSISPLQHG